MTDSAGPGTRLEDSRELLLLMSVLLYSVAAGPLSTLALFWEAQSPYAHMCEGRSLVLNRPCFPWEAGGQLTNQVRQDKL